MKPCPDPRPSPIARTVTDMDQFRVTRENLSQAVESTLSRCRSELEQAERARANYALTRDLRVAVEALQLVDSEIHGKTRRAEGQRSAVFTRYAVDEEERMTMDSALKDLIVQIEHVYGK